MNLPNSQYDRWKMATPEDELDAEEAREAEEADRIERMIDDLAYGDGPGVDEGPYA